MAEQFVVFFSNHLEILYQNLKNSLFASASFPFTRRLVVVYGPAMKNWLMLRMAQDPELGIATGLEFIYLNQAFETLLNIFQIPSHIHIPTQIELAFAIEKELRTILQNFARLSESEQKNWLPLIHYLKLEPENLVCAPFISRKMERRLVSLSEQLAHYFREYGRYAGHIATKWETLFSQGWQQQLWRTLFNAKTGWSYPYREFQQALIPRPHCEVHFFSISFISRCEFEFLGRLEKYMPIYYYMLSPCAVFWSDIRSDKEAAYLQTHWQQKLGYTPQVVKLEELLRDRNALLANFGRLGREMANHIEELLAQNQAYYLLPNHVKELDPDLFLEDDLHFKETQEPLSLLHAIQADILIMRNPQHLPPHMINNEDLSIQLHVAPTKQREVQILYHNLMHLIEKESSQLCPSDIIVMAPHIMEYVPYIESVFGTKHSQLDFQILDLGMQSHNEIVQGFWQLVALSESRWDVTHLLQLFGHKAFQRRHQLAQSDFYVIQEWIEKAGIRWGEDLHHRNELLERHHCPNGMVEKTAIGTWDYGLTRLLLGLATVIESSYSAFEIPPYENIDFSQGDLLGQWIHLLHSLRDDLTPLHDRTQMTLGDWADYLTCLLENYFQPDLSDSQSIEDYEDVKAQFEVLRTSAKSFKEAVFSFQSIKVHLQTLLQQRGLTYRENYIQTIRFCSMTPLRSIPAKVIALMGLQEGAFPRVSQRSSLNLMADQEYVNYYPNSTDLDRHLFLEAIHSAQDYLIMSYQGYNYADSKEMQPSLIVEELFSYLDKHYQIQGQVPSKWCKHKHPFDAFNEDYFQYSKSLVNYSFQDYRAAQIYYHTTKQLPHRFIREFSLADHQQLEQAVETAIIDLRQLIAVARNPIKFHLNKVLDIYIEREEDRQIKNEEDLYISSLDKHVIKHSALKQPLEEVLIRAEKEGKMPLGLFKSVASKYIEDEVHELRERLKKHQLRPEDLFVIEFCIGCTQPTQLEANHWLFPAVTLLYPEGKTVKIVGKLAQASPKGLVVMSKGSLADAWKAWPQFLLYNYATKWHPDKLECQLIMTQAAHPKKAFFDDPIPYLKQFVDYHNLCMKNFSPLLPEWISLILEGDTKGLQDKMRLAFSNSFGEYQSQDLRWVLHKDYLPDTEKMIKHWKIQVDSLLGDLIHHWYSDKHSNE